jgi:hypothetical protein
MGNQRTSGLTKRGGIWHIDKQFRGARVCESTGTGDIGQAKEYLAKRVIELRETRLYGTRELRSFRSAATKYLQDYNHKKRIKDDALQLKQLDPFIGSLELKQVHMGSLQDFIAKRRQDGVKTKTLNMALAVVRRVLNVASSEWMDRQGKTWLEAAPKIKLFPVKDARSPYPSSRRLCLSFLASTSKMARNVSSCSTELRSGSSRAFAGCIQSMYSCARTRESASRGRLPR